MAEVLVVVEASQAAGVKKVTLEMLTIARGLGSPSAVVFGDASALTDKLAEFGAEKIYVASGEDVEGYLVAPAAPTSPASTPRSASDSVCTGFFLAAMMPLKDG